MNRKSSKRLAGTDEQEPAPNEAVQPVLREAGRPWMPRLIWKADDPDAPVPASLGPTAAQHEVAFYRGVMCASAGELRTAISLFREAIKLKPDFPEAHYNLGFSLSCEGQQAEAISAFRKAIKFEEFLLEAHHALGQSLASNGQFRQAIAAFREAINHGMARTITLMLREKQGRASENVGKNWGITAACYHGLAAALIQSIIQNVEQSGRETLTRLDNKKLAEAEDASFQAVQLEPDNDIYRDSLASVQKLRESYSETPSSKAAALSPLWMQEAFAKIGELAALLPDEQREPFKEKVRTEFEAAAAIGARAKSEPRPAQPDDAAKETETSPSVAAVAAETTRPEKPHWKDVRRPGEELANFIKREFEPELATGTMMRPLLKRYRGLHEAFYNHLDKLPPELQRVPTKSQALDRQVGEGKMTDPESIRSAERDRKRTAAAHRRARSGAPFHRRGSSEPSSGGALRHGVPTKCPINPALRTPRGVARRAPPSPIGCRPTAAIGIRRSARRMTPRSSA